MGVVTMTIGGVNVMPYVRLGSLEIEKYINARPVLRCDLNTKTNADTFRADINQDVIVTDGGTRVFGGTTYTVVEQSVVNNIARNMKIDAVGYEFYADKGLINGIVAAGTLQAQMTTVVNNISHGIVVDPAQAAGPNMPAQGFPFLTCRAALDQLSVVSGYIYAFDDFKNAKMYLPGSVGAPFALTDLNSTMTVLKVTKSLQDYINSIWIQFGGNTQQQVTVTLHGDGSTRLFPLGYVPVAPPTSCTVNGIVFPVGIYGVDALAYTYRQNDPTFPYSLIQDVSQPVLQPTDNLVCTFTAQFPGAVLVSTQSEITANGVFAMVMNAPNVYDSGVAQQIAQGELNRRNSMIRTAIVETTQPGLLPGMTVAITSANRNLSSVNFLITAVKARHINTNISGTQTFLYEITAIEGTRYQTLANWAQYFRRLGSQTSNAGAVIQGGTGSSPPANPSIVTYASWGGSRDNGRMSSIWVDVHDFLPIKITGNGQPQTVRVFQATEAAGTSVQARIVKRAPPAADVQMASTPATTNLRSAGLTEQPLTFTPVNGTNDYVLQVQGSNANAPVYAIAISL